MNIKIVIVQDGMAVCLYDNERGGSDMENNIEIEVLGPTEKVSSNDREMDRRATCAIKAAVTKAKVCNKPIAKYDSVKKLAYLEYADGRIEYAKQ